MIKLIVIVIFFLFNFVFANNPSKPVKITWDQWKEEFINEIREKDKFSKNTLDQLNNLRFNAKVVKLDRNQPEFKLSFQEYLNKVIPSIVIEKGIEKKKTHKKVLNKISTEFAIDKNIIVALWGIESFYGKYLGNFDILNSLASLIYDGRRKLFFTKQFEFALEIIEQGHISRSDFTGSWAGAFGHTQFMSSTFVNYSVDFNNDGRKNLISDNHDALASGANYLSKMGWINELSWGEEFLLDGLKIDEFSGKINEKFQLISYWKSKGFKPIKYYNEQTKLRLISIKNEDKKKFFLVTKNFDIILRWNKSNFFALAVGLLSDKFKKNE